ncbi:MAG: PilZ domain-containing protein [Azoarcus sp.]|jgi:hypothetical protein|nr:PilZ domain-containing protein [Azoarcus sp.]
MPSLFPFFVSTSFSHRKPADDAPKQSSSGDDASERRINQRFVARLRGEPCFWALVAGERIALNDISLKGFALPATPAFALGTQFDFTLLREGVPDEIRGRAEITGLFDEGSVAGCRIIRFEGDGPERLQDWLVAHVIRSATVRITEKDAAAIVAGHSLV